MPLYEYECDDDHHRFEVIQKFSDPPIDDVPDLRSAVQKLVSSPAIQFKGSGWYITDYARAGKSDEGRAGAGRHPSKSESGTPATESKGESKTDSKTDSKTESKSDSKAESKAESKSDSKPSSPASS